MIEKELCEINIFKMRGVIMNPILATYAQDVLDKNSDKILESVTSFVKKAWEKFKVDFNLAFRTYINQSYDKYSKIKTILYRIKLSQNIGLYKLT